MSFEYHQAERVKYKFKSVEGNLILADYYRRLGDFSSMMKNLSIVETGISEGLALHDEISSSASAEYAAWAAEYRMDYRMSNWRVSAQCVEAKAFGYSEISTNHFDASHCPLLKRSNFKDSYWCGNYGEKIYNETCENSSL